MDFYRRYSVVFGLLVLAGVMVLLLSTPGFVFSKGVMFIDTELNESDGDETYIKTKVDFGSNEHIQSFPQQIGKWIGSDYETDKLRETLGADVLLMRAYVHPEYYLPIFLLISQSNSESSFHGVPVCFRAMGYSVDSDIKDEILIPDGDWVGDKEPASNSSLIPIRRLIAHKESDGSITERRVVLYWYVKGNEFTSDTITMIRISTTAPIEGSYDAIVDLEKDFTSQCVPHLFELSDEKSEQTLIVQLSNSGLGGYILIILLLSTPIGIMLFPRIILGKNSLEEH
ncbi:MAG: exosortase-associated EpsI family protein [Chloroflexota bacterium]|nr:exosortase-associated EpsI family protein [Chloroflexota bacterium]